MSDRRRSPHLILGLAFGASKSDAARAFAQATRRLRSMPDPPFDLEDLNWALHAIEQRDEDPGSSIDEFRVPADASAYDVAQQGGTSSGHGPDNEVASHTSLSARLGTLNTAIVLEIASAISPKVAAPPLPVLHRFIEEGT